MSRSTQRQTGTTTPLSTEVCTERRFAIVYVDLVLDLTYLARVGFKLNPLTPTKFPQITRHAVELSVGCSSW